jgi:hypothetical protein
MNTVQYVPPSTQTPETKIFLAAALEVSPEPVHEQSEVLVQKAQTLTAKPLTLKTEPTKSESLKMLLNTGVAPTESSVSLLEITTGPISVTEKFTVRIFINKPDANAETSINDPSYVGRISALDSQARRGESGAISHSFPIVLGGRDSRFYKLVHPGEPFRVTLVPVGSAQTLKGFLIPIKEIKLKVIK